LCAIEEEFRRPQPRKQGEQLRDMETRSQKL
jgi:hypothetical protein